jgi:hypothetical protein
MQKIELAELNVKLNKRNLTYLFTGSQRRNIYRIGI